MLVKTVCPQCNGVMEVDDSKERIFCPYCGTQLLNVVQKVEVSGEIRHIIDRTDEPNLYISYGSTNQELSMSVKLLPDGQTHTYVTGQTAVYRLEPGLHSVQIRVANREYVRKFFIREDNAPVRINVVFDGRIHINIDQPEFTNPDGTPGVIDNRDVLPQSNALSNVAFIFSFIPILGPVSIILSVIDLLWRKEKGRKQSKKTIAALIIAPVMILLFILMLAAQKLQLKFQ